jgi:hypothetical protein
MRLHLSSGLSLAVTAACLITIRPVQGDTFYVSSVNGNEVYQISSAGTVTPLAAINLLPEGLAIDPRGRLYIANDGA